MCNNGNSPKTEEKKSAKLNGKNFTRNIAYIGLATAILCVLAPLSVPSGIVPVSLATFAVFFVSATLGWKRGTLAVIVYILLGLIGLPVFANFNAGVGIVAGPTGGFIVGYVFCALITGLLVDLFGKHKFVYPLAMASGLVCCYLFGTFWYMFSQYVSFAVALTACVVPFLFFDAIKIAVASFLSVFIRKTLVLK